MSPYKMSWNEKHIYIHAYLGNFVRDLTVRAITRKLKKK